MNNESKMSSKNKRCQNNIKNTFTSTIYKPLKSNCSSDSREDHCSNNRISKQKMSKQPSTSQLRQSPFLDIKHSPILTHSRQYGEINNKENGSRQVGPIRSINKCLIPKRREHQVEPTYETSPFSRFEDTNYRSNSSNSNIVKDYRKEFIILKSEATNRNSNFQNHQKCKFRCQTPNCYNEIAYYAERSKGQEYICCYQCGVRKKQQGFHLKDIKQIINKNSPEAQELWQKINNANDNILKVLSNLQNHKKSLLSEIQYQLHEHNIYYDSMCQVIQKKKQQTRKLFEGRIKMLDNQFKSLKNKIYNKKNEVESLYKDASNFINSSNSELSQETKNYMIKLTANIPSENEYAFFETQSWKVEVGNLKDFEKDIEKYVIKVTTQSEVLSEKPTTNTPRDCVRETEEDSDLNQLMCDEELEWGVKPKPKNVHPKVNQMYFSFEKHNSIIYENADEHISSPGFKQI